MSGTRGGIGRIIAMGVALAVALLLLAAGEARAGKYSVVQCGWFVGADADWADNTGGAKFSSDGWCVPAAGADPFDGVHLKSLTRDGQGTVSGTRFARWRWVAPAGTGIVQVRGTWWHALHDGLEQRLGVDEPGGGFDVFAAADGTDTAAREFVAGFAAPVPAFEDRLLCARAESKWCSLEAQSWSGLRALTLTLEDDHGPDASFWGELAAPGWHRGRQSLQFAGADVGGGVRFGETTLDGNRVALTEYPCATVQVGGEWRGKRLRPCEAGVSGAATIDTAAFSDGPHLLQHCTTDFAGNPGCPPPRTILIDNNAPAHPRSPQLAGGEGWRRTDDFDLSWTDPDQGPGSPIAAAAWRIAGPGGFDGGVKLSPGVGIASLSNLSIPAAGEYALRLWLRDEAGNEDPAGAVTLPLRFDDVPPQLAFAGEGSGEGVPAQLDATVADPLSGPASGQILYRRADGPSWVELPTRLLPGGGGGARLTAPLPTLDPGTYLFRADATDVAGNSASTTLRADGTRMEVRRPEPPAAAKTRLFARLEDAAGSRRLTAHASTASGGETLTIPFGAAAILAGRLTRADGSGLAGRRLRVLARPSTGAAAGPEVDAVTTGPDGGFELRLPPGPSRRLTVSFPGEEGLAPSERPALALRVRAGISLTATPRRLRTGELLRLRGRVATAGARLPRRGKLVAIQYREAATGRWRPVLVARSDHDGRFYARYRFRYVSGPTRIRLRATALSEEAWPFAPGSSSPLEVVVDGDR
jgi:hypothetical protein